MRSCGYEAAAASRLAYGGSNYFINKKTLTYSITQTQ